MNYLTRLFSVVLMAAIMLATIAPAAEAGRVNGRSPKFASVAPGEKAEFYVRFQSGVPAVASVVSLGNAAIEMTMIDAAGQFAVGRGTYGQRIAQLRVIQSGVVRIEVYNMGPEVSMVRLQTN